MQGLIDGIGEKFTAAKDKVKELAGGVKSWIKGALNINSPSRWMRDMIGHNIVLGIIDGIVGTQPELKKTMEDLPTEMVDSPSVKVNAERSVTDEFAVNPAAVKTGSQDPNEKTEVHLHLTVYGDMPDTVINQMAQKLKTKLSDLMDSDAMATGGAY